MKNCSLIIAVYNKEPLLDAFFDCILSQGMNNKEAIFIDDCSTDGTLKKLLSFAKINQDDADDFGVYLLWKKNNILILHLKQNSGPSIARRLGIENATGKFFACVDPDDLIDPGMYDVLYNFAVVIILIWFGKITIPAESMISII